MEKEETEVVTPEIKSGKNCAQILIKFAATSGTLDEAIRIIEGTGIQILQIKKLPAQWVLFKLSVRDMRIIALKLTEHGFINMKGVNALPRKA
jgi:hypothetical protein